MIAPFNVTIIQPPGYQHSQALGEVWIYLADALQRCGLPARATVNSIKPDENNIILCAHVLPPNSIGQLPPSTIIFNSEKLEQGDGWYLANGAYADLIRTFTVWDYSARNLAHVQHQRKAQIPFYFAPILRKAHPRNPDGPVLFYGCITDRRRALLEGLHTRGVPVSVGPFGVYGEARDKLMYQARAILNLHTDDERKVFEPVRCFHPLINGIPVITEQFHDEPMFDIYRRSTFVVGSDPVAEIAALLADPQRFRATAKTHLEAFAASDPLPAINDAVERYFAGLVAPQRHAVSA